MYSKWIIEIFLQKKKHFLGVKNKNDHTCVDLFNIKAIWNPLELTKIEMIKKGRFKIE